MLNLIFFNFNLLDLIPLAVIQMQGLVEALGAAKGQHIRYTGILGGDAEADLI